LSLYLVDEKYTAELGRGIVKEKGATLPLLAFVQGPGATIANLVPPAVIRGLIGAAGSSSPRVRFDAAYVLAVLGRPLVLRGQFPESAAAVASLTALLRDSEPVLRQAGTNALGRLFGAANLNPAGNKALVALRVEAGDQVVGGMNDADPDVRLASMGALGEMRYERAIQSLTDVFEYYKKGAEAVTALDAVARIAHAGSLPVLLAQIGNRDATVRRLAVEGIGRIQDKPAMADVVARTAREQSPYVVYARAFARARNGDLKQIAKLVEGFKYSLLESEVFAYLVELGAPGAPELVTYASHKDSKVRAGVAEVLGVIGDESAVPALGTLARDKSAIVASAAARSQARLTPRVRAAARLP
jgi:HEAT repeat protein